VFIFYVGFLKDLLKTARKAQCFDVTEGLKPGFFMDPLA
jgi:hypothetical protein